MKKTIIVFIAVLSLSACVSSKTVIEQHEPFIDIHVKQWLNAQEQDSTEKLSGVVKSSGSLQSYDFLKLITPEYYSGQVSLSQLQRLMQDRKILRIAAGKQKLH